MTTKHSLISALVLCGAVLVSPPARCETDPLRQACGDRAYVQEAPEVCANLAKIPYPSGDVRTTQPVSVLPVPNAFYVGFDNKPIPFYGTLAQCVAMASHRIAMSSSPILPNSIIPKPEEECIPAH